MQLVMHSWIRFWTNWYS